MEPRGAPAHPPTDGLPYVERGRSSRAAAQAARESSDEPETMDAVSLANVNASSPAVLDHGPTPSPLRKAVSQDEASALALLTAMPAPQLATSGMLGTQLDAWA